MDYGQCIGLASVPVFDLSRPFGPRFRGRKRRPILSSRLAMNAADPTGRPDSLAGVGPFCHILVAAAFNRFRLGLGLLLHNVVIPAVMRVLFVSTIVPIEVPSMKS